MGDLGEEFLSSRRLEHSDANWAEVINTLEDRARCDMSATMQDASAFIELPDVIIYKLAEYLDIEALRSHR